MPAVTKPTSPAARLSLQTRFRREYADLLAQMLRRGRHQQYAVLRPQFAVDHPHQHHDADIIVEPRIDDQRLERGRGIAARRRNARNHRFEYVLHALARLGARAHGFLRGNADDVFDLRDDPLGLRRRQVDLVDHRHDFDALLGRGVAIGDGLRFDALRGIDHQQRAFARRQRTRHLVREIHVPGRVDQVEQIGLPVPRAILKRRGLRLDRDAALALEIHGIEHLRFHFAVRESAAQLDETVGKRGLAVIDVRDDGKISNVLHVRKRARVTCPFLR